jgi:hypothetical protein
VEPEIVHIPSDTLIAWGSEENTDGLLAELTRFNVQFSTERFRSHFPGFEWEISLAEGIRRFVEYQDEEKLVPEEPGFPFEDEAVNRWRKAVTATTPQVT